MRKLFIGLLVFVEIGVSFIGALLAADTTNIAKNDGYTKPELRKLVAIGKNEHGIVKWYIAPDGKKIQKNDEDSFIPTPEVNTPNIPVVNVSCTADGKTVWVLFTDAAISRLSISNDYGKTFETKPYEHKIDRIALSKDGSVGYAMNISCLYTYRDGKSYSTGAGLLTDLRGVACTADGKTVWIMTRGLFHILRDDFGGDSIWKSTDYGENFECKATMWWVTTECLAVSDDGKYIYVPTLGQNETSYITVFDDEGKELEAEEKDLDSIKQVLDKGDYNASLPIKIEGKNRPFSKFKLNNGQLVREITFFDSSIFFHSYDRTSQWNRQ